MNKRGTRRRLIGATALLIAVASLPAAAHHSFARFDMSQHFIFQGTVEKWLWSNPHSWLYVRVEKKDGTQEVWGFEAGGTNMLARSGWNAADMKPGDKVSAIAAPERSGTHGGLLEQVQLPDGRVLKMAGFAPLSDGSGPKPPVPPDAAPPHPPQPYQ